MPEGLLGDLKVVDLSRILAGPWATQLLGDMGANVVKVERLGVGDDTRKWGPPFIDQTASYFYCTNRNKESIAVDFQNSAHLTSLKKLILEADILVENFKPGGLRKFGLDYESLKSECPKLIYCSILGFPSDSQFAEQAGYDAIIQAMSGLISINGTDEVNVKTGVAVSDLFSGMYAATGILAAVHERKKSGLGQKLEISLLGSQVACLANVVQGFLQTKENPKAYGTAHPSIVPYQVIRTADRPVMLAVGNDNQFAQLCEKLGVEWNLDSRFSSNASRVENREILISMVEAKFSEFSFADLSELLIEIKVPHGPVNSMSECYDEFPELFGKYADSDVEYVRNPIQFSRSQISYDVPPDLPSKGLDSES